MRALFLSALNASIKVFFCFIVTDIIVFFKLEFVQGDKMN